MRKLYIFTLLMLFSLVAQDLFAQKTLTLRVTNLTNSPGRDCDGVWNDSDWQWTFGGDASGCDYLNGNNSANSWNPNRVIFGTNTYYSRNCWPTTVSVQFRYQENDNSGDCDAGGSCSRTDARTTPAWNAANGNTAVGALTGNCTGDCPTTITYGYSGQFEVGGSNFNAQNLDVNGYVNNTTACTAINLGSGTSLAATGNYATQCTETWYYYTLTSNRSDLTFNPSQDNGSLYIYYSASAACGDLCFRTSSGGGAVTLRGAPAGRYYFRQLSSGGGNTNVAITSTTTSHDEIQFATTAALNYSASVNNSGFSEQGGELEPAGDIFGTWWYTFVTPPGGYPFLQASISQGTGENSAVAIYRFNSNNCSNDFGTNLTTLASDRWCASSGGSVSTNCLAGNTRYYVQFGTAENFAACTNLLNGTPSTGSYNISITTGSPGGPDGICAPHNFGTISSGYNSGDIYYNNSCLSISAGETRTGDMSNTMWYKFRTPAGGLESVNVNVEEAGEGANLIAVALYQDADATCAYSGMTERAFDRWCASSGGDISYNCLPGNTDFYIQLGTGYHFALCNDVTNGGRSTGRYRLRLTSSSYATGPDNICSAVTNFTINSTSGSTSINDQSNLCAGTEGGEPGDGQKTVWYRFTTGATVPYNFTISMDAKTNGLNSDVYVYESCGGGCTFGALQELDNFFNVDPLPGEKDADGTIEGKIKPNGTYYIRADGVPTVGQDGGFDLDMSWSGTFLANDNYCGSHNLSSGFNYNSTTITHAVNTDNASSEDRCTTNEPDVSDEKTAWWRFTTGANPPAVTTVNPSASGLCTGQAWVYSSAASGACTGTAFTNYNAGTNNFNGLSLIGSTTLGGDIDLECLAANTTYYILGKVGGVCSSGSLSIELSSNGAPKPTNNDVCSATAMGASTPNTTLTSNGITRNNFCANATGEASWNPSFGKDQTVWYSFTTGATVGANIQVSVRNDPNSYGDQIASELAVFTRTSCNSGTVNLVAEDNPIPVLGNGTEVNFCPAPNTNYWIMIDHDPSITAAGEGYFDVRVIHDNYTQGPDNICSAVTNFTINSTTGSTSINDQSNLCAGTEGGEPGDGQKTVWYRFTTGATVPYNFTISMDAKTNGLNSDVYVYESCGGGCTFGALQELDNFFNVDPLPGEKDADGTIEGKIKPNSTYYIRADGVPTVGVDGGFDIDISWSGTFLANDNYCGAHNLSSAFNANSTTVVHSVNTDNASSEDRCTTNEPDVSDEKTAWWRFTTGATPPATIRVNPDASGLCTGQAWVYSGVATGACTGSAFTNYNAATNNFNGLTLIDYTTLGNDVVINCPTANTTYYIMGKVGGVCSSGSLTINLSSDGAVSVGDICSQATSLGTLNVGGTIGNSGAAYSNICANPDTGPSCSFSIQHGVWFTFTTAATVSGYMDFRGFNTGSDDIDLQLVVYEGSCASLTEVDCDYFPTLTFCLDGLCSEDLFDICVKPSTTYYVLVDGGGITAALEEGTFGLTVTHNTPPSNDLPCNATVATVQPFNTYTTTFLNNQTNVNATPCFEPDSGWTSNGNDHGVWYKFNSLPGRRLVIDANSLADNIDIQLALYEGNPGCSNLTYVNRDWFLSPLFCVDGLCDEDFIVTDCLAPDKEYYLMVDGGSALGINGAMHEGTFSLRLYYPREGGLNPCLYNAVTNPYGAPRIGAGAIPTSGSAQLLNNSNFCGLSDADLALQGIPSPAWSADDAVFYVFRPPTSGSVKITATSDPVIGPALGLLSGNEIDLQLAVYEAAGAAGSCTPASWSVVASASNSLLLDGYSEYVIVNCLDPDKDYYLLVDGTGLNTVGFFDLLIEDYGIVTTNDLQCDAIDIVASQTLALQNQWRSCNQNLTLTLNDQNNYCADNINEPTPVNWDGTAKMVWYKFDAPPSGGVHFELNTVTSNPFASEYLNGALALYDLPDGEDICTYLFTPADEIVSDYNVDVPPASTGEDMNDNNILFPDNRFVYCLTPGRTYYLAVDGWQVPLTSDWDKGEFSISIESSDRDAPAVNTAVCDAKFLGDLSSSPLGTTVNTIPSPPRHPTIPGYCMRAENNFCANNLINGVPYPTSPGGTFGVNFDVDQAVWYQFIAPASTAVEIRALNDPGSLGDQIDLQIGVFETSDNTCTGAFQQIKGEYDLGFFSETVQVNCLEPGKPYWLMVDGSGLNMEGYFEIEIEVVTPTELAPPNDDICDATTVTPFLGPVTIADDRNRCATLEAAIPEPSTFEKDFTVWYEFITPGGVGPYAVEVNVTSSLPWPFGDAIDPQIAVYKSSNNLCSGTITEHFSDYSTFGLPFTETSQVHCLEPNTRYFVMIDGSLLNLQGFYDITLESITPNPIAVNNNRCDVVSLPTGDLGTLGAAGGSTLGGLGGGATLWNNFCADVEVGEPDPGAFDLDQTVWFKFRTPLIAGPIDGVNVNFYLDNDIAFGDQIDLQFAVYQSSGGCNGTFTEMESSYNPLTPLLNFFDEEMDLCLREDTEYWIQVDGSALNTQGYFKLRLRNDGGSSRPINDDFCNATNIVIGTPLINQNNNCATVELGEPLAGADIQKSVWYKFTAPASGRVEIRTVDADGALTGIDPEWYLYEFNGSCTAGAFTGVFTELASAYFPTLGLVNPDDVEVYECLFPGREYYIQVDGTTVGGPEGVFDISVTNVAVTVPSNNSCSNPIALSVNTESCQYSTGTWSDQNYGTATRTLDNVPGCGSNCGDTWYSFTMPATGFAKIEGDDEFGSFGSNNSELVISAFRGTCGALVPIQCDNGGVGKDPDYSIAGTPGETIFLQVYSANGNSDDNEDLAICVSERCAADECPDYITMVLGDDYCWDVRDATTESASNGYPVCGAPTDPEKSVYFRFDTDDFCWGYQIIIETSELSANGNCILGNSPTSELIMSVYQDSPGALCDGNPIAVLDCEVFDDCSYPGGVNTTITYLVGPLTQNIKANSTYIIQLNARDALPFITSDDVVDGTIKVRKLCDGREWQYAPLGTTVSTGYCEDSEGWRHYYNDAGTPAVASDDILIYSLRPNGNNFEGTATIGVAPIPYEATAPNYGSWVMRRHWDFTLTSGSIDPSFPVDVRFYYQDAEKNEIIADAQAFAIANGLIYEPFEWYKSANGSAYVPTLGVNIIPERVIAEYGSGVATGAPQALVAEDHDFDPTNEWCNGIQYVEIFGLTGFSGGSGATGASPSGGSPLPVELISFVGWNDGDVNELEWVTATELNNELFVIERSADAINFVELGTVDGNGTTNYEITYNFTDFTPIQGVNYYRLKQIDFDGTFEYSSIIAVEVEGGVTKTSIVKLHPNPANELINMQLIQFNHCGGG
jgi:hypothetical protein